MGIKKSKITNSEQSSSLTLLQKINKKIPPYIYISPFFIGFILFQLVPIAFSLFLGFADWNGMSEIKIIGFENFIKLFQDAKFWNAFSVTFIITVVCTIVGTAGATLLAVILEKVTDKVASILRVFFFLPSVTSVVVIASVWKLLYSADYGLFNNILLKLNLPPQEWLTDVHWALPALIIMLIWAGLGWDSLIIAAGLRSISEELYDAGKVDGTNAWTEFWHITLPLLRPTLLFVLVTGVIFLWGIYAQASLLTGGGPLRHTQTIAMYLYDNGFRYHRFGYASAIAIVLSLVMFISSFISVRLVRYEEWQ